MNRREFLRLAGAGTLGMGAMLNAERSEAGTPPAHEEPSKSWPRVGPILGPEKTVLTVKDFTYLGMFKVPDDPPDQNGQRTRFGFSLGTIAARYVDGKLHFVMTGADATNWSQPVYEIAYPGVGLDLASAPRAPFVRSWGDVTQGRRHYSRGSGGVIRGLLWHDGYLWWAYGDPYNAGSTGWDPSIGCSALDDVTGAVQAYGPWRTTEHSQRTRGYMLTIPDAFATRYVDGHTKAVGAPLTSGNAASPWGPALFALAKIDPTRTPPDPVQTTKVYTGSEPKSLPCRTLLFNGINHPATRPANYWQCGWNVKYDCSKGAWLHAGPPTWQDIDFMDAAVWIDGPTKHGVIFFGNLVAPRPGVVDAVDWPHSWYGPQTCCHGRVARKAWGATGPGTDSSIPYWYLYDPQRLADVVTGHVQSWMVNPSEAVDRYDLYGTDVGFHYHGGAWFDSSTKLLFVSTRDDDNITNRFEPRPVIRVFRVNV